MYLAVLRYLFHAFCPDFIVAFGERDRASVFTPTSHCPHVLSSALPCLSSFRSGGVAATPAKTEGSALTDRVCVPGSRAAAAPQWCFVLILFGVWAL